jgi:hypothetical protein
LVGDRGWNNEGMDDALDENCTECGGGTIVVLFPSGRALCSACAAIEWRIPSVDPVVVTAEIRERAGISLGS